MFDEIKENIIGWGGFLSALLGSTFDEVIMFVLGLLFLLLGIYNRIQHVIINRRTINRLDRQERDILDKQE